MLTVKSYGSIDDLPKEIDRSDLSDNGSGKEYASYIVAHQNDKILYVESDAMEPEDARFYRDLSWIEPAIRQAYEIGLKDGKAT